MPEVKTRVFRPARSSYLVWLGIVSLVCALWLLAALRNGVWRPFWICVSLIPIVTYWVAWREVRIGNGIMTICQPFRPTLRFEISQLRDIKFRVGGGTYTEKLLPPFRLEFTISENGRLKRIWINAKFYSLEDIKAMESLTSMNRN